MKTSTSIFDIFDIFSINPPEEKKIETNSYLVNPITEKKTHISKLSLSRRRCRAIVPETGLRCKAAAIAPGTNRTRVETNPLTGKKKKVVVFDEKGKPIQNDSAFCQMHQPNREIKCRCKCHKQEIKKIKSMNVVQINLTEQQKADLMKSKDSNILNLTQDQLYELHNSFGNRPQKTKKTKKRNSNSVKKKTNN
jgi:hypothetical protein